MFLRGSESRSDRLVASLSLLRRRRSANLLPVRFGVGREWGNGFQSVRWESLALGDCVLKTRAMLRVLETCSGLVVRRELDRLVFKVDRDESYGHASLDRIEALLGIDGL